MGMCLNYDVLSHRGDYHHLMEGEIPSHALEMQAAANVYFFR